MDAEIKRFSSLLDEAAKKDLSTLENTLEIQMTFDFSHKLSHDLNKTIKRVSDPFFDEIPVMNLFVAVAFALGKQIIRGIHAMNEINHSFAELTLLRVLIELNQTLEDIKKDDKESET